MADGELWMEILISMLKRLDGFDISQTAAQHVFKLALLPLVLFAIAVSSLFCLSLAAISYATLLNDGLVLMGSSRIPRPCFPTGDAASFANS